MEIKNIIPIENIVESLTATTKEEAINEMVSHLKNVGALEESKCEETITLILEREALGSTGIGQGIAIPHAKESCVDKFIGCFAHSSNGVDFGAIDGELVYSLFMVLVPIGSSEEHLAIMRRLAQMLRDSTFCKYLKQAETAKELRSLVEEIDERFAQ